MTSTIIIMTLIAEHNKLFKEKENTGWSKSLWASDDYNTGS
jgi:hypothetical protein